MDEQVLTDCKGVSYNTGLVSHPSSPSQGCCKDRIQGERIESPYPCLDCVVGV